MSRAQLRVTLTPKFSTLQRIVLVVTCAPSLEICYVLEVATQHMLHDFGKYDIDGTKAVHRWYKFDWKESTDGVVRKMSDTCPQLFEVISRTRLSGSLPAEWRLMQRSDRYGADPDIHLRPGGSLDSGSLITEVIVTRRDGDLTRRPSIVASGSAKYPHSCLHCCTIRPQATGIPIHGSRSQPPASSSSTRAFGSSLSPLANTQPADPAPTMT
jgi:hypothetical protein